MNMKSVIAFLAMLCVCTASESPVFGQVQDEVIHRRGRLWELVRNDGWIGSLGAWDFLTSAPLGLFPGFDGYTHPIGNEFNAYPGVYENGGFHNFRSGMWILGRNLLTPGTPPAYTPILTDYELYAAGLQAGAIGVEAVRPPIQLLQNFNGAPAHDPLLPEESSVTSWNTNTGITVARKSYVWSYPGYEDFIIYDYSLKNTGAMVSNLTGVTVPAFPTQTLSKVYVVFHSGISVSTKSQINFHDNLDGVAAGAFGFVKETFHDFYNVDDDGTLVYSTNYNGGASPPAWDPTLIKSNQAWKQYFGNELLAPAAFGWLALYASPATTPVKPRVRPEQPDILRIDSHKGGDFPAGQPLDLEKLRLPDKPKKMFYDFATTADLTGGGKLPNVGNRMNFYTLSYGPYTLAPGDSIRFILAEIAGVMDYHDVIAGGNGRYPDSSIAAIRRNAAHARNAVRWGLGASVNGISLAASVPEPPPGPNVDAVNASLGKDTAVIAVTWDRTAEKASLTDGSGAVFYNGASDLQGYRIYRSTDFQYVSQTQPSAFRGAAWDLLVDIPFASASRYFDATIGKYKFDDRTVTFGFKYGYYVQAYWTPTRWVSANGTVVTNLPELANGSANRTFPTSAAPGPERSMDVFVAPNPFVYNDPVRSFVTNGNFFGLEFRNLPELCTIRIYTVMGDLVRTLEHKPDSRGNMFGSEPWDLKTNSGLTVAPGLYVYHVKSTTPGLDRSLTGKLMIIR